MKYEEPKYYDSYITTRSAASHYSWVIPFQTDDSGWGNNGRLTLRSKAGLIGFAYSTLRHTINFGPGGGPYSTQALEDKSLSSMSESELSEYGIRRIDPDGVSKLSTTEIPKPLKERMTGRWVRPDGYVYYIPDYPVEVESTVEVRKR